MLRLGLDIGTNSIGWTLLILNKAGAPVGIKASGARIFSDGRDAKSGASLAEDRRIARSFRRRRDRFLRRRDVFLNELIATGLMSGDEATRKALELLDPYELRATALDQALPLHHIGRALFHINQRRGFQSNRKADRKAKDDESGKVNTGIARLIKAMEDANAPTLGYFLHHRRQQLQASGRTLPVRTRLRDEEGEDAKGTGYDFYPNRQLLKDEFAQIWTVQAAHHAELTDTLKERLHFILFGQRPLKAPKVGRCTFSDEERLPKAHPLFQQRRLYEEVNALEVVRTGGASRKLTIDERDKLILKLKTSKAVTFASLGKLIKLDDSERFNKESESRKDLKGDEVFAELSHKLRFGNQWAHFDAATQYEIIDRIQEEEKPEILHEWLTSKFKLDDEAAKAVANAHLPEGHGRLGFTATRKILDALKAQVITYDQAVAKAELGHHSDFRTGEVWDELPYYGEILDRQIPPGTSNPDDPDDVRFGRITNPTVHIGLGQLKRIVNQIICVHGKLAEIVVELARDLKLNEKQKKEVNRKIKDNTEAAKKRSEKLINELKQPDTGANRALLKMWEELNQYNVLARRCPYCGEQISARQIFTEETDIDHILPYSKTLDDTPANKIIAHSQCNRAKRNRAPFDAFGQTSRWPIIAEIADKLPKNKRWRFAPNAMEKFADDEGFLARQLVDTQYLSKMARSYLSALYPDKGDGSSKVWVIPGQMTEMLRRQWGLNSILPDHNFVENTHQEKNRLDHRHHAIDAAVIAVTDRGLLQYIAREAGKREEQALSKIVEKISPPWPTFRDDLKMHLDRMIVSHKADHGKPSSPEQRKAGKDKTAGRLHNDTAYGLTNDTDAKGNRQVVHRVPLTSLKDVEAVRDPVLREELRKATQGKSGKEFEAALRDYASNPTIDSFRGLRHVRIIETLNVIPVRDQKGEAYKGYKGDANYCFEVWRLPDGSWKANVVTMFGAHQVSTVAKDPRPHPAAKRLFRLYKDDLIAGQFDTSTATKFRVVKFSSAGALTLAPHNESGSLKARDADKVDPFKYINTSASGLKKAGARQIRIDELGHVWDPGPREKTPSS
jgi:CRISPR-associated endonuclease Csn1